MANPNTELLEIILRECAAARPQPWYPSEYARATGVPRAPLDDALDELRANGLVHLTPWVEGHGQGYQLTQHGMEVLVQPRLLARLRQGQVTPAPAERPVETPETRHALSGQRRTLFDCVVLGSHSACRV